MSEPTNSDPKKQVDSTTNTRRLLWRRTRRFVVRRQRALTVLVMLLVFVPLLVQTAPSDAAPNGDLPDPSDKVHTQTIPYNNPQAPGDPENSEGPHQVSWAVMPTGGKWYFQCPAISPGDKVSAKKSPLNVPYVKLDMDKDRCGSDGTANYLGVSSWTSSLFANVVVSPSDARCGALMVSRTDAFLKNLVGPRVCKAFPQIFPTQDDGQISVLVGKFQNALGTCSPHHTPGNPMGCSDDKHPARPLQYWPLIGDKNKGYLDCNHILAGHVPPAWTSYAGGDAAKLKSLCGWVNSMLRTYGEYPAPSAAAGVVFGDYTVAPPSTIVQPMHDVVADLISNPPPDKGNSGVPKWVSIAVGAIGGCVLGGVAGFVIAGPVGAAGGCVLGGGAGAGAAILADKFNCSLSDVNCIFKALTGWAARGMVKSVDDGMSALNGNNIINDLLGTDMFTRLYTAYIVISALVILIYALLSVAAAMAWARPGQVLHTMLGVVGWGIGLGAAVPFTALLLKACDEATDFICRWGGSDFSGLGDRLHACITNVINSDQFGGIAATGYGFLLVFAGMIGGFFLLWWAVVRAVGLALAVIGMPLALAAGAGPRPLRQTPVKAIGLIISLALFKPMAATVFVFAVSRINGNTSTFSLMVGTVALLFVCFNAWGATRLIGGGLELAATDDHHRTARHAAGGALSTASTANRARHSAASRAASIYNTAKSDGNGGLLTAVGKPTINAAQGAGKPIGAAAGQVGTAAVNGARSTGAALRDAGQSVFSRPKDTPSGNATGSSGGSGSGGSAPVTSTADKLYRPGSSGHRDDANPASRLPAINTAAGLRKSGSGNAATTSPSKPSTRSQS